MKLSIITTLYNSSVTVDELTSKLKKNAQEFAGDSYEIILVNDGSNDDTVMKVKKIISGETNSNNNIKLINLSRNFGHHKALMTGINFSKGEFIFLLESDLEEDPEWLKDRTALPTRC